MFCKQDTAMNSKPNEFTKWLGYILKMGAIPYN